LLKLASSEFNLLLDEDILSETHTEDRVNGEEHLVDLTGKAAKNGYAGHEVDAGVGDEDGSHKTVVDAKKERQKKSSKRPRRTPLAMK
jgi:hypothetical protein